MKNLNVFLISVSLIVITACQQPVGSPKVSPPSGDFSVQKLASGSLSATPTTCVVNASTGLCTTTINWSTSNANIVQIKANGNLFAAAQSGSATAPWINENPTVFELFGDGILLASVTVTGKKPGTIPQAEGKLTANPATCVVNPSTHLCSTTISWTTTDAKDVKLYANGNLFTWGLTGSANAPWIGLSAVLFELKAEGVLLDSISVVGTESTSPAPTPNPGDPLPIIMNPGDCQATDATSLNACARGLVTHKYTGIALMNDIICSGPRACDIHLDHFTGPARIYGYRPDGKNVTIYRKDFFDTSIIEIVTSSDIEIRNIDFREGEVNKPAGLYGTPGYDHNLSSEYDHNLNGDSKMAEPPISIIFQSKNIFIDHIGVYEAKLFGMIIGNCDNVTVRNSTFVHNWSNGIWVSNGLSDIVENDHAPIDMHIENNVFIDNRCVAIGLSTQGNSWVSGNYMSHNHSGSLWHASGGQFSIEETTKSLIVADNEITNGYMAEDSVLAKAGWKTVAVEFTDSGVHGVTLDHNYLHNNTGGGVIHDPKFTGPRKDFGPIYATDNVINNPWTDFGLFDPGELIQSGNCSGTQCTVFNKSTGKISTNTQTCNVGSGSSCSLTLTWSSKLVRATKVKVLLDGKVLSNSESGVQMVPLMKGLHRFDLYDGVTLLDSVHIGAI